jgi:hypothetical protein
LWRSVRFFTIGPAIAALATMRPLDRRPQTSLSPRRPVHRNLIAAAIAACGSAAYRQKSLNLFGASAV